MKNSKIFITVGFNQRHTGIIPNGFSQTFLFNPGGTYGALVIFDTSRYKHGAPLELGMKMRHSVGVSCL